MGLSSVDLPTCLTPKIIIALFLKSLPFIFFSSILLMYILCFCCKYTNEFKNEK